MPQWHTSRYACNGPGTHVIIKQMRVTATVQTLTSCAVDHCAWPCRHSQVVVTATARHTQRATHASVACLEIRMQWAGHACDEAEACGGNGANTHSRLRRRPMRKATPQSGDDSGRRGTQRVTHASVACLKIRTHVSCTFVVRQ